jgi:hypothetical protein
MNDVIQLTPQVVAIIAGVVIPILTGLVTKLGTSSKTKAVIAFALSAIAGALAPVIANGDFVAQTFLISAATVWVIATATYFGFYQPTGTTDAVQAKTQNFGI